MDWFSMPVNVPRMKRTRTRMVTARVRSRETSLPFFMYDRPVFLFQIRLFIPGNGPRQAFAQTYFGLPFQGLAGIRDVRLAHARVVHGQGLEGDPAPAAGELLDLARDVQDRDLGGVADVHGARVAGVEQAQQALRLVVDVAERAG